MCSAAAFFGRHSSWLAASLLRPVVARLLAVSRRTSNSLAIRRLSAAKSALALASPAGRVDDRPPPPPFVVGAPRDRAPRTWRPVPAGLGVLGVDLASLEARAGFAAASAWARSATRRNSSRRRPLAAWAMFGLARGVESVVTEAGPGPGSGVVTQRGRRAHSVSLRSEQSRRTWSSTSAIFCMPLTAASTAGSSGAEIALLEPAPDRIAPGRLGDQPLVLEGRGWSASTVRPRHDFRVGHACVTLDRQSGNAIAPCLEVRGGRLGLCVATVGRRPAASSSAKVCLRTGRRSSRTRRRVDSRRSIR